MREKESDLTGPDLLVQRWLDQELTSEERVDLLVRLGHDEALRQQLIRFERLVLGARGLPRPEVPDGFVAGVMERTVSARPAWRRVASVLLAPRTLRWNLAGAGAAACLVLLAVGGLVLRGLSERSISPPPVNAVTTAAPTPALVRLVLLQPDATTVTVAGDFNGWDQTRTPLERVSSGAWTVTIPLEPGRYEYMFVIDDQRWIADPFAIEQNDDGFGSRNAVLDVRPPVGVL